MLKFLNSLKQNILNALNVVALALPISIGYGILSGLGPIAGIIGLLASLIISIFIGAKTGMIRTPIASITIIVAIAISEIEYEGAQKIQLAIFTFILAGIIQIIIGKLDLGKFVKLMPYSLVKGVMIASGILLMAKSIQKIFDFNHLLNSSNLRLLILSISILLFLIIIEKKYKKFPAILFAIIIPSLICYWFKLDFITLDYSNVIEFTIPNLEVLQSIPFSAYLKQIPSAFFIGIYASLSTLLVALILDGMTDTKYDVKKELMSLGSTSLIASFFGGIPSSANLPISILNIKSNQVSRFTGLYASIIIVLLISFLGFYLKFIPIAVITSVLIYMGYKLIDFKILFSSYKIKESANLVLLTTIAVGVFDTLLHAIIAGFVLASIQFMYKMSQISTNATKNRAVDDQIKVNKLSKTLKDRIRIINLDGPFFFGTAEDFYNQFDNLKNDTIIIVNFKLVPYTDDTGLNVIYKAINKAKKYNVAIYLTGANSVIYKQFEDNGIVQELTEKSFYQSVRACLKMLNSNF
jgi:SulP family sulfate permease